MNWLRLLFFWSVVLSFVGMGLMDFLQNKPRLAIAGVLLAIVQVLIFWRT